MNLLKRKAVQFIEKSFLKSGKVIGMRHWDPPTICEIDLHLPLVDMSKWTEVQHIKVKVDAFEYRDYTPVFWDAETHTCTLIIDISHPGKGSSWAQGLQVGDNLLYVGLSSAHHKPSFGEMMSFADTSSMAHMLALEYLTKGSGHINGVVVFDNQEHVDQFSSYFKSNLQPQLRLEELTETWQSWLKNKTLLGQTIYIAGNIPAVVALRKSIKSGYFNFNGNVKAEGFWK